MFYLFEASNCKYHVSGNHGTIHSPNYPFTYGDGADCSWIVEGPVGSNINIQVGF